MPPFLPLSHPPVMRKNITPPPATVAPSVPALPSAGAVSVSWPTMLPPASKSWRLKGTATPLRLMTRRENVDCAVANRPPTSL